MCTCVDDIARNGTAERARQETRPGAPLSCSSWVSRRHVVPSPTKKDKGKSDRSVRIGPGPVLFFPQDGWWDLMHRLHAISTP